MAWETGVQSQVESYQRIKKMVLDTALLMLYSHHHDQLYKHICIWNHNDTIIKTSEDFFKKYTSHFIWKVRKGLLKVLLWEGVGERTELQHIDPQSDGHQRCVFLVLKVCSTGGLGAQFSAECWFSLPHLVFNLSGLQTRLTSCLHRVI